MLELYLAKDGKGYILDHGLRLDLFLHAYLKVAKY